MSDWFKIYYKFVPIDVKAEIEKPTGIAGQFEDGSIEIKEIYHCGSDIYNIVCEIKNFEEDIIDEIRKQL